MIGGEVTGQCSRNLNPELSGSNLSGVSVCSCCSPPGWGAIVPVHAKLLQSCPTLWDLMDCNLPGSSVHEFLWARVLEWVATPFSNRSCRRTQRYTAMYISFGWCGGGVGFCFLVALLFFDCFSFVSEFFHFSNHKCLESAQEMGWSGRNDDTVSFLYLGESHRVPLSFSFLQPPLLYFWCCSKPFFSPNSVAFV